MQAPTHPAAVSSIEIEPLDLPLFEPFGISGGAQAVANNVLVRVELAGTSVGLGEGAPLPPYNGETQAEALMALQVARNWLLGRDARDWASLGKEFAQKAGPGHGAAQCALEAALLDAVLRHQRVPMVKHFGGAEMEIETDMTVTCGTADQAAAGAQKILRRGIRIIKVKIGGSTPAGDLERIRRIREITPNAPLILDGNAGLSRSEAAEMIQGLKAMGIVPVLLEQWLAKDDLPGMRSLGTETGWLVAADEAVSTAEEASRIVQERAAGVINVKLMKRGIAEALEVVRVARDAGLGLMIGANIESRLGTTVSASFAAGKGGFRFADLDTPLFLTADPFGGGCRYQGGVISLGAPSGGHGIYLT